MGGYSTISPDVSQVWAVQTRTLTTPINPPVDIYGDGSDGDVIISVNTTLTRDMQYHNLTINAGVTVITGNFRIKCTGTLLNLGTLNADGLGGTGGQGSDAHPAGNGLAGQTVIAPSGIPLGGGGGGGGNYSATVTYGGIGGNGGGLVYIAASFVVNRGTISAKGTNGTNGTNGSNYPAGGGGGGGGGVVIIIYRFVGSYLTANVNVAGGASGTGVGAASAGSTTGGTGGDGAPQNTDSGAGGISGTAGNKGIAGGGGGGGYTSGTTGNAGATGGAGSLVIQNI